jgi:hypothetical protein
MAAIGPLFPSSKGRRRGEERKKERKKRRKRRRIDSYWR